jgi:UDP-N-acetylglucosamine enolpyruvyl transferase
MEGRGEAGDRFVVEGGRPVGGTLVPAGNKNEALPALAATLLAPGPCTLENVPDIADVRTMLEILVDLGVDADGLAPGRALRVDSANLGKRAARRSAARSSSRQDSCTARVARSCPVRAAIASAGAASIPTSTRCACSAPRSR